MIDATHSTIMTPWSTRLGTREATGEHTIYAGDQEIADAECLFSVGWDEDFSGREYRVATLEGVRFGPLMICSDALHQALGADQVRQIEEAQAEAMEAT